MQCLPSLFTGNSFFFPTRSLQLTCLPSKALKKNKRSTQCFFFVVALTKTHITAPYCDSFCVFLSGYRLSSQKISLFFLVFFFFSAFHLFLQRPLHMIDLPPSPVLRAISTSPYPLTDFNGKRRLFPSSRLFPSPNFKVSPFFFPHNCLSPFPPFESVPAEVISPSPPAASAFFLSALYNQMISAQAGVVRVFSNHAPPPDRTSLPLPRPFFIPQKKTVLFCSAIHVLLVVLDSWS